MRRAGRGGRTWTMHERRLLQAPAATTELAFLPDGKTLASAHADGVVRQAPGGRTVGGRDADEHASLALAAAA